MRVHNVTGSHNLCLTPVLETSDFIISYDFELTLDQEWK